MHVKPHTLLLVVASFMAATLFSNCKKDGSSTSPEPTTITMEKSTAKPLEIVTVLTNKTPEAANTIVSFNDQSVNYTIAGSHISFMVPQSTTAGTYTVAVTTLGEDNSFLLQVENATIINDVDGYISDLLDNNEQERTAIRNYQDTLLSLGLLDSSEVIARRQFWDNMNVQDQQRLAQMTTDEKAYYVQLYDANKAWIDNITSDLVGYSAFKDGSTSSCKQEYDEAKAYYENASNLYQRMRAYWKAQSAYKCLQNEHAAKDKTTELGKAAHLAKTVDYSPSFAGPLNTVINQVSEKIDELKEEVDNLGKSPSIAEEVEDAEDYKTQSAVEFCNAVGVKFYLRVKYRTIRASDANTNTPYAAFAKYYANFISSYDAFVAAITEPTVQNHLYIYRPDFVNETRVLEMNRFLSVPENSVSNNKAILLNTQFANNGDDWVVIFATDEDTDQDFSFDIVYDDGLVKLTYKVDGTVGECEDCGEDPCPYPNSPTGSLDFFPSSVQTINVGNKVLFTSDTRHLCYFPRYGGMTMDIPGADLIDSGIDTLYDASTDQNYLEKTYEFQFSTSGSYDVTLEVDFGYLYTPTNSHPVTPNCVGEPYNATSLPNEIEIKQGLIEVLP